MDLVTTVPGTSTGNWNADYCEDASNIKPEYSEFESAVQTSCYDTKILDPNKVSETQTDIDFTTNICLIFQS